jgi:hypothetical protein
LTPVLVAIEPERVHLQTKHPEWTKGAEMGAKENEKRLAKLEKSAKELGSRLAKLEKAAEKAAKKAAKKVKAKPADDAQAASEASETEPNA